MRSDGPNAPGPAVTKGALAGVGVALLAASAIFGGNPFGVRDNVFGSGVPAPAQAALSPFAPVSSHDRGRLTVLRSQPWWQKVTQLRGQAGTAVRQLVISSGAIQWRGTWRCARGTLQIRTGERRASLLDARCPATGTFSGTRAGRLELLIGAVGSWTVAVDQQVDIPLEEPPLPSMTAPGSSPVAAGAFERIDQFVTGRVTVYRLANGRYSLRLANFYVTPNVDLQIRLSRLRSPRSTRQYLSAPSVQVAELNVTAGSLNFSVPPRVDPAAYHSVVIWCPLVTSAYGEAPLRLVS